MIIKFTPFLTLYSPRNVESDVKRWSKILKLLREESGFEEYEYDLYYKWLEENWKIKIILANNNYPGGISTIDVDDANYTMLLMRFQ